MHRDRLAARERLDALVEGWAGKRLLVVGDLILDEYRVGDVDRVSPEAPVPVVNVRRAEVALGGAGNVARNLVSLGAEAELVGLVGRDLEADRLRSLLEALGVDAFGLVGTPDRPTSHKLRVVARGQQMLRLDREENRPIDEEQARGIREMIESKIEGCEAVILEDYDKGVFASGMGRWVIELARERSIPVAVDPKADLSRFRGASLVKPNLEEALRFCPGAPSRERFAGGAAEFEVRRSLLEKIQDQLGGGDLVVTQGALGMMALEASGRAFAVPTRPLEVYDVQGAGDTTIAALALARASGASLAEACIVANAAAAVVVDKVGTAAVDPEELRGRLDDALEMGRSAITDRGGLPAEGEA